jgi:hypothetical protein
MPNQPCALMLPDGSCYDPDIAQDHTGVTFGARPKPLRRDPKRDPRNFMKSPAWLQCPHDGTETFRILVEDHPRGDGMMQLYCPKCHDAWPVLEMHQPQMNNNIAKQLGLPEAKPAFEMDIDMGAD